MEEYTLIDLYMSFIKALNDNQIEESKGERIMVGLYEYDTATAQECIDDLQKVIEYLSICDLGNLKDLDVLETLKKKGQRVQYIAERLIDIGGGEDEN